MGCFTYICTKNLEKYQSLLEKFEGRFDYKTGTQHFAISHGMRYAAFAESIGSPLFLLIKRHQEQLVGCLALIRKKISYQNSLHPALYIGDLKIAPEYQLTGLSSQFYAKTTQIIASHRVLRQQFLIYFAAIQNHGGDFATIKGQHSPLHLFKELALLQFFIIKASQLAKLRVEDLQEEVTADAFLNLSPETAGTVPLVDMKGIKDYIRDGKPLNLVHLALPPVAGTPFIQALQSAGKQAEKTYEWCCFALDTRRMKLLEYLAKQGIQTESMVKIYGISLEGADFTHNSIAVGTYQL